MSEVICITIDEAIERIGNGPFQRRMVLAAGLCFAADAMEILLLSFLGVVVQAEWDLTPEETAGIVSVVFLGALFGTLLLGPMGDKFGRKPAFVLSAAIIAIFGLLTAAATDIVSLLILRFLVGMGVGGLIVPFDTIAEFVPTEQRASQLLYLGYYWTFGSLLVPILAYFTLGENADGTAETGKWRIFVILCAIPCIFATFIAVRWVPESPHWLVHQGRTDKALEILRMAAGENGLNVEEMFPATMMVKKGDQQEVHSVAALFQPEWRGLTLRVWATWFAMSFLYYGTIILVTIIFSDNDNMNPDKPDQNPNDGSYDFDYAAIFLAASAEIVGNTMILMTVDRLGRVHTQAMCYLFAGFSIFALAFLAESDAQRGILMTVAFLARLFMMGADSTTWVSTAEMLPTQIRNTGHATANACARIGGTICPFLVSPTVPLHVIGGVMGSIAFVACLLSWTFPETQGKALGTAHSFSSGSEVGGDFVAAPSTEMPNKTKEII